jgi:hypothetical protein
VSSFRAENDIQEIYSCFIRKMNLTLETCGAGEQNIGKEAEDANGEVTGIRKSDMPGKVCDASMP